jgi:ABC-type xylose transport system substrate-binding protein
VAALQLGGSSTDNNASRVFNVPQTALHRYTVLKIGRKAQMEQSKQNWVGSKFFIVKQKMIWLSTVF